MPFSHSSWLLGLLTFTFRYADSHERGAAIRHRLPPASLDPLEAGDGIDDGGGVDAEVASGNDGHDDGGGSGGATVIAGGHLVGHDAGQHGRRKPGLTTRALIPSRTRPTFSLLQLATAIRSNGGASNLR